MEIQIPMTLGFILEKVYQAIKNEGRAPSFHRKMLAKFEKEWPALFNPLREFVDEWEKIRVETRPRDVYIKVSRADQENGWLTPKEIYQMYGQRLYWVDTNGDKRYIQYISNQYLENIIRFIQMRYDNHQAATAFMYTPLPKDYHNTILYQALLAEQVKRRDLGVVID